MMPNLECSFTLESIHVWEVIGKEKKLKVSENVLCVMQKFREASTGKYANSLTLLNLMLMSGFMAAKMAGMRYIVAMPKHADGFAMYDSKVTDYDIMDATPFGRDPMDELYQACQETWH